MNIKNKKKIIIFILCAGMGLLFFVIFLIWSMFGNFTNHGLGKKKLSGITPSATDINYYKNQNISGLYLCDFKISEKDFIHFANNHNWKLMNIDTMENILSAKAFISKKIDNSITISNGLFYSKRTPDGRGVTVAYDRSTGRGYIVKSNR